jgi:indole-3-glycerol phosphate synthase
VSWSRRFSQAISEGDGISLLADVAAPGQARAAEEAGAEAIVVRGQVEGARETTALPILWCGTGWIEAALRAGADAVLLVVEDEDDEDGRLEQRYAEAVEAGLDCVVGVRDEEELESALERLDPEVFLLRAQPGERDGLEHVLTLLPDVPAGKLAVAELDLRDRHEVEELERAGVDGVVAPAGKVAELLTAAPPAR